MSGIQPTRDKSRILIISSAMIGHQMSGPAVRCFEFANVLSKFFEVSLATPIDSGLSSEQFQILTYGYHEENRMQKIVESQDIILIQGQVLEFFPFLKDTQKVLIVDLYCPFVLEDLEKQKKHLNDLEEQRRIHEVILRIVQDQILVGDYFLCANERQRDFWLGMLCALNRINPYTYNQDPSALRLLDVIPFGISSEKPVHSRQVLKGAYKGITEQDTVLIWGGSILSWLDTLTLIKAMDQISRVRKDIKLFFMGTEHPDQIRDKMVTDTLNLSKALGLTDKTVFFHTWAPYRERQNYFLEADIGISTHFAHLETRFSFRTRILDYIWTGLPVIATKGDHFAELIQDRQLGLTVGVEDVEGLAAAILKLVEDPALRQRCSDNVKAIAPQFTWKAVTQPLIAFCKNPQGAADKWYRKSVQSVGISSLKEVALTSKAHLEELYNQVMTQVHLQKTERDILLDRITRLEAERAFSSTQQGSVFYRFYREDILLARAIKSGSRIPGLFKTLWNERRRKRLRLTQYPSCKIRGFNTVGQSFMAGQPNLYRIDIKFATYMRRTHHNLIFHLKQDPKAREDLVCIRVNTGQLRDNTFYAFTFSQQPRSEGASYYFYLESPDLTRRDAVSVWCTDEKTSPLEFQCLPTQRYERGWKVGGHVVFKAHYK